MWTPFTWWLAATLAFAPPTAGPATQARLERAGPLRGPRTTGPTSALSLGVAASRKDRRTTPSNPSSRPPSMFQPPDDSRRVLLGLELVGMQVPTLVPGVVRIDPRGIGRSATMIGLGALLRVRVHRMISLDVSARSGTLRFRDQSDVVDHDRFMTEIGVLLDFVRTQSFRLGVDGGAGLSLDQIRYTIDGDKSRQRWLTGLARIGLDIEFSTRRLSFLGAVRLVGAGATPSATANRGPLFRDETRDAPAPIDPLQLWIVGVFGVAYRF